MVTPTTLTVEQVAKACYDVNHVYCRHVFKQHTWPTWDKAPLWRRDSMLVGVNNIFYSSRPIGAEENHINWCDFRTANGWTFGLNVDARNKRHPALVPFNELSKIQRTKHLIFVTLVQELLASTSG